MPERRTPRKAQCAVFFPYRKRGRVAVTYPHFHHSIRPTLGRADRSHTAVPKWHGRADPSTNCLAAFRRLRPLHLLEGEKAIFSAVSVTRSTPLDSSSSVPREPET